MKNQFMLFSYYIIFKLCQGFIFNEKKNTKPPKDVNNIDISTQYFYFISANCENDYCKGPIASNEGLSVEPQFYSDLIKICQYINYKNIEFDKEKADMTYELKEQPLKVDIMHCINSRLCRFFIKERYELSIIKCYLANYTCKFIR